ncbi:MAG: hypothetical protein ABH821_01660 [archaeon]
MLLSGCVTEDTVESSDNSGVVEGQEPEIGPVGVTLTECADDDVDCFITALEDDCHDATLTWSPTFGAGGSTQTTTSYYEIENQNSGDCLYTVIVGETVMTFSPEIEEMMTEEQKQQTKDIYANLVGETGSCIIEYDSMADVFRDWQVGTMSTTDLEEITSDCEGILRNGMITITQ